MAPPSDHHASEDADDSEPELLAMDDALEEVGDGMGGDDDGEDVAMDSGDEAEELLLSNDSIAYFDAHKDSVFAIAQHPTHPTLVATGGSEGDADDAPGKGYVIDTAAAVESRRPLLPASYSSDPAAAAAAARSSTALQPLFAIEGHTDSINALAFTLPDGAFLLSGGLDGRMRAYGVSIKSSGVDFRFVGEAQEVPEINWLAPCPAGRAHPNTVALGASDGSVWVYTIDPAGDPANPLQIVQSYFLHQGACTAGAWTPDGQLLATVSEDGSLHVWDVWGAAAAAANARTTDNGQTVVSLTTADQRFAVEGGLFSVAVSPGGGVVAVGGAGGVIKVVGLPRLTVEGSRPPSTAAARGGRPTGGEAATQAGAILASLQVQSDGVETLSFAPPPLTLLAAGSVDGSVAVYDAGRSFAVRRHIAGAHDEFSVVKVEWVRSPPPAATAASNNGSGGASGAAGGPAQWLLTSCGMDGVVRRWDLRGATTTQKNVTGGAATGLVKEWRGHRGDGEGGGVLGFVQGETGERIVTAGDDGVVLVFEA
ncbi:60S ribosome biogenesis protein [Niveomyces insectorum RCEF 264]|uniref:60S ribosome biogenesis protein n=1 Tax=Niveomyces insectorum RCEF 264 TaxID=1081102 RepID=A0A167T4Z7_9HYPO|nr:60S ribosome biogenesis protein [Niveomyces insectorum RCEF 264]